MEGGSPRWHDRKLGEEGRMPGITGTPQHHRLLVNIESSGHGRHSRLALCRRRWVRLTLSLRRPVNPSDLRFGRRHHGGHKLRQLGDDWTAV